MDVGQMDDICFVMVNIGQMDAILLALQPRLGISAETEDTPDACHVAAWIMHTHACAVGSTVLESSAQIRIKAFAVTTIAIYLPVA